MSLIQLVDFFVKNDERGCLTALESPTHIPFVIKRIYYLTNLSASYSRGFHAHKQLIQIAVCLQGSCRFLMDDGSHKEEITLASSNTGLVIPAMVWHEMHDFSDDCILMVVADEVYQEEDYIRNYDDFMGMIHHV